MIPDELFEAAAIGLFHAVGQWNSYYCDTSALAPPEQMKAGVIIFATVSILLVYPFI